MYQLFNLRSATALRQLYRTEKIANRNAVATLRFAICDCDSFIGQATDFIITCQRQIDRKSMLTCLAGKRCVVPSVPLLNKTHFKTLVLSKLINTIPRPPISEILDPPLRHYFD